MYRDYLCVTHKLVTVVQEASRTDENCRCARPVYILPNVLHDLLQFVFYYREFCGKVMDTQIPFQLCNPPRLYNYKPSVKTQNRLYIVFFIRFYINRLQTFIRKEKNISKNTYGITI